MYRCSLSFSARNVDFRVLCLFQEFGDHDNIIKLLNVIKADNDKDSYLVFEYMGKLIFELIVSFESQS